MKQIFKCINKKLSPNTIYRFRNHKKYYQMFKNKSNKEINSIILSWIKSIHHIEKNYFSIFLKWDIDELL